MCFSYFATEPFFKLKKVLKLNYKKNNKKVKVGFFFSQAKKRGEGEFLSKIFARLKKKTNLETSFFLQKRKRDKNQEKGEKEKKEKKKK